ncbi:hypothetical protein CYMTET_38723 [Cymbomonas tetramitiformis]|uniref:Uncharacterized protein n=1 Tax=Cymbomonas tetramitiformis TaxID=36881 RepID=A0AAE0CD02_9CHLO|nr:hypothetical protein CYMTET_38723 [Cymbomonas tetramitiformis]
MSSKPRRLSQGKTSSSPPRQRTAPLQVTGKAATTETAAAGTAPDASRARAKLAAQRLAERRKEDLEKAAKKGQRRKQEAEEKRDVRAKDAEAAHEASVKSLSQPSRGVSSVDVETLIETSTAGRHPTRTEANTSGSGERSAASARNAGRPAAHRRSVHADAATRRLGSASEMLEDIMGAGNVADFQVERDHVHAMALMAAQEEARAREMEELQLAIAMSLSMAEEDASGAPMEEALPDMSYEVGSPCSMPIVTWHTQSRAAMPSFDPAI